MLFQRLPCAALAQVGYVLADGGEAVVVDPRRDIDDLLRWLQERHLRVRYAVATHVHADFVVGLHEVAASTGAEIALGAGFTGSFPHRRLEEGALLPFGDRHIEVLATPGHTLDSITLRVGKDEEPIRLLTGDTLFVGDVGRPDLASGPGRTARQMASLLYESLQRLAALPDDTEIWPAHGAGSACGSCIGSAVSSTLAAERAHNWALRAPDEDTFCSRLLAAHRTPPPYFARLAAMNLGVPALLRTMASAAPLTVQQVGAAIDRGARVLDVRSWSAHGRGHWPGACNIGLEGGEFEPWAGALLTPPMPVVLHADHALMAQAARRRLLRVGIDDVLGFCCEPPPAAECTPQIDALDLFAPADAAPFQILDVRGPDEFAAGHVPGAIACELSATMGQALPPGLDRTRPTAVLCEGGYRSSAALAGLRAAGFTRLHNVQDGMRAWRGNHLPLERPAPRATS